MPAIHASTTPEYDPPYTLCPLCQSRNIALYHCDYRHNRIFRCADCCVQFMNPVYSDNHLTGYDVDCDAMQRVSKRLGVPVRCGELSAVEWPAGSFDLVHAHHVVEHLKHP